MNILGIGGLQSNPAAALVKNGELAAAVEEKKIARQEAGGGLPQQAIQSCLHITGLEAKAIDCVAVARPLPLADKTGFHLELRASFPNARVLVVEHHTAHAAAAWYPSPFEEATVLTLDRTGDFRSGTKWRGKGSRLEIENEMYYPDSLGDMYGRVTELLGYRSGQDEHKVQWLSTEGDDRFVPVFTDMLGGGEWPRVDQSWIDRDRVNTGGFSSKLFEALGIVDGSAVPSTLRAHVAAGVQRATEQAVLRMVGTAENVCIGGGLAMNVLIAAALERRGNVFVQPAGGNSGNAIGAAAWALHHTSNDAKRISLGDLCLGPEYRPEFIKQVLENCKLDFSYLLTDGELIEHAVRRLSENRIIAWMQGRMEFGPRALGNRSILASPLDPYSSENLNTFIKHREPSRKFAASVPVEAAAEYFEAGPNARYLATVGRVRPQHRKTFAPALLGGDMVRVHTVDRRDNPLFHQLLLAQGEKTGLPVLYNTSFNLFGDPLVCSPRDAVRSYYSSGIDALFVGHFLMEK